MILVLGGLDITTHPQNHVSGISYNLSIKAPKYSEDRLTSI